MPRQPGFAPSAPRSRPGPDAAAARQGAPLATRSSSFAATVTASADSQDRTTRAVRARPALRGHRYHGFDGHRAHAPRRRAVASRLARVVAALLGLLLSGAPRALVQVASVEQHRCHCRSHASGNRCPCPACHRLGRAAGLFDRDEGHEAIGGSGAPRPRDPLASPRTRERPACAACSDACCRAGMDLQARSTASDDLFCGPGLFLLPIGPHILRFAPSIAAGERVEPRQPETPPPRPS